MRRPIRPFRKPHPRAITGPAETPPIESRAQRLKILAATPGATMEVIDPVTVRIECEAKDVAQIIMHRVQHACALIGVGAYEWICEDVVANVYRVEL